jgi:uncharacterized coiled-coil protein SlyX
MNRLIQRKIPTSLLISVLLLAYFGLTPSTPAVVPAPDGGYPGGNTAEGHAALLSRTTGGFNTAVGYLSLRSNTDASFNTAVGAGTLLANTTSENTAVGAGALLSTSTGSNNTANGALALFNNTIGNTNTASGESALLRNTTGSGNTADGEVALDNNTTGNLNTALGIHAGTGVTTADMVICIGAGVPGDDVSNTTWIGNVYGVTTQSGTASAVIVSDSGQLGTVASSERFKKDITPMAETSETILALRPVTFHYKSDAKETPQFGLIAEEVAKVDPALVLPDKEGKPYTVRYEAVNAMLLNEFLKEHRNVQEQAREIKEQKAHVTELDSKIARQEARIAQQQKGMEVLTAQLKEQDSKIQKVNDQLKLTKPVPQIVNNSQ